MLILYYRKGWMSIENFEPGTTIIEKEMPFISVIIAARNEEKNIEECIQSIIDQNYSPRKFEIIITNDHSTDKTVSIIHSFQKENIHVIDLVDFTGNKILNSYKKKSIETALQFAKGELIVTTDADCIAKPKWLETIASFYRTKKPVFIVLPVAFENTTTTSFIPRFFESFQSLDFMTLQGITGASVYKKFLSMCNGANLAYEKKIFQEVNGFEGIDDVASGDDMLLMQKVQKLYPEKIMYLKSPEVIIQTKPPKTFRDFMNQRIRWASKTGSYTDKKMIAILSLVYLLNAWIFILGISSFFFITAFYLLISIVLLKILIELLFLFPVARFF
ncbi:MAG: glycosyltransferase, partial [Ginsengibacter sp.]